MDGEQGPGAAPVGSFYQQILNLVARSDERNGFAYVVALMSDERVVCSGVALGRETILTSAHCVCGGVPERAFIGGSIYSPTPGVDEFRTYIDIKDGYKLIDENACKVGASAGWDATIDLAILRPTRTIDLPASSFPSKPGAPQDALSNRGLILGFGASNQSDAGGVKRIAMVHVEPCNKTFKALTTCRIGEEYVVVNPPGTTSDTCYGDSGGPLITVGKDGRFRLLGITSRKIEGPDEVEATRHRFCGSGGVYVSLLTPRVQAWLDRELAR